MPRSGVQPPLRGLICDDHPLMREALIGTLRHHWPSIETVPAGDYPTAWALAAQAPDFCLVDLCMPGAEPIAGLQELKSRAPGAVIMVITGVNDSVLLDHVRACGVAGVYPKNAAPELLVEAIGARLPQLGDQEATRLPARQQQILTLLAEGLTNKEIAKALGISPATVKVHVSRIATWFGAANRTEAVANAQKAGLL